MQMREAFFCKTARIFIKMYENWRFFCQKQQKCNKSSGKFA